jgi:hypothetical protein
MAYKSILTENWTENKVKFQNEISSLKISMADYIEEKKSDWEIYRNKFFDNLDKVEESFRKMDIL